MSQGSALRFCKAGRSLWGRRRFLGWVIANRSKSTIEGCLAKKPRTSLNLTIHRSMNMLLGVNLNLDRNGRVMLDRITGHVLAGVLVVSKETAVRVCELAWSMDIVQSRTGGWKRKKERARNSRNPWQRLRLSRRTNQGGVGIRMPDRRPVGRSSCQTWKKKRTSPKKEVREVPRRTIQHSELVWIHRPI